MPEPRRYTSATAFRAALETRLPQQAGGSQTSLGRLRRRVAFERLLARLFGEEASPWLLKGGYALELRLGDTARATRDLDLASRTRNYSRSAASAVAARSARRWRTRSSTTSTTGSPSRSG